MATRTRRAIGGTRTDWILRLIGLVVIGAASAVLLPAAGILAFAYFALAFIWAILTGNDTGPNNWLMGWLRGVPRWYMGLVKWALLGDDFPGFLPSRA